MTEAETYEDEEGEREWAQEWKGRNCRGAEELLCWAEGQAIPEWSQFARRELRQK